MTTIATDASVRSDGASWGAVVVLPGRALRLRGALSCVDPNEAELLAVHRALRATRKHEPVEVVVDNTRVLAWLQGKIPPARFAAIVRTIRRMLAVRQGQVRWTKAHVANEDRLHRQADRLARTA